jgi:hypothetical protein
MHREAPSPLHYYSGKLKNLIVSSLAFWGDVAVFQPLTRRHTFLPRYSLFRAAVSSMRLSIAIKFVSAYDRI